MRNCLYCGAPIPDDRHKNAWTCTKEHAMLLKKEREAANYQKVRNTADPIIGCESTLIIWQMNLDMKLNS